MLGSEFFAWTDRHSASSRYDEVISSLMEPGLAVLLGADAVAVDEILEDGSVVRRHGSVVEGAVRRRELGQCSVSGVVLIMSRRSGDFSEAEVERFDAMGVIVRCTLRRLCSEGYLSRMRERLFSVRRESQLAIFVIQGLSVTPFNAGSVECAEHWWGQDQLTHELTEEQGAVFWEAMATSWRNPVEADWIPVRLDIGGGEISMDGMARHGGGALLMYARAAVANGVSEVPLLTRRQCGIMDWIAEGKTSAEVGTILQISSRTVEKHLEAVFNRFGVDNRVAAVRMYLDLRNGKDGRQPVA